MVSTRGPRYKFSEGEKVLCYEPDPTKVKVLYDSKVLQVIKTKDKRGRPVIEYLIHFQGWNSSWDRCVSEDLVLKDTDENRQLQRSLAEKSRLQIGAYLYRPEGKKKSSTAISNNSGSVSERRGRKRGLECEGSSSSGDPDAFVERESGDTESSSQSDSSYATVDDQKTESVQDSQATVINATINLGPGLKDRLTLDFQQVMKHGRILSLPARPSVLEILESCVKQFAAKEATAQPRQRRLRGVGNPPQANDQLNELLNKLNLLHEIADGIRIYFDYLLNTHLLYKPEFTQYKEAVSKNIIKEVRVIKEKDEKVYNSSPKSTSRNERHSPQEDYAHLPPSPKLDDHHSVKEHYNTSDRRLRSHKQLQILETEGESSHMSVSNSQPGPSSIEHNNSSSVSGSPHPQPDLSSLGLDSKGMDTIQKALTWHIVPADNPPYPSAVYGATHLARLFVKLPEFLCAINMAEMKLKLIMKYIEIFVEYLEQHDEWFGETYYCETASGPS